MASIHAHEFLSLIGEADSPQSLPQLVALAHRQFGESVRFHTCKLQDLEPEALLAFLIKMEKIVPEQQGYVLNRARVCNH
ncbi:YecH family metal-binding protein [Ferrimonas gelatinilytica]|uniref:YecH family protein n=1 Tax=Ferrimonas gelatinilytica TaxID=1255257 RepID=A0ABP9S6M0_9GAMM